MPNRFAAARARAFLQQCGRCYYCSQPMWLSKPDEFARLHGIPARSARTFQCTAEHLKEKSRGGKGGANIVAACRLCNLWRHRHRPNSAPPADKCRRRIKQLVSLGRWRVIASKLDDGARERP